MIIGILEFLLFLIVLFVYFLPAIVAYSRGHKNALAIFILDLFLGYTFVGWVGAMIWSVYNTEPNKQRRKK